MRYKAALVFVLSAGLMSVSVCGQSQDYREKYEQFKKQAQANYGSFRDECNKKYADFLRQSWEQYKGNAPVPRPKDDKPVPPKPYEPPVEDKPVVVKPVDVTPVVPAPVPQPKPVEPIRSVPTPDDDTFAFDFYSLKCKVKLPDYAKLTVNDCRPGSIADGWEKLCGKEMNNAIRNCLETRLCYNLCDWAYLEFLNQLASEYCSNRNSATLLAAYLYCQSGYQMRLGEDGGRLVMLYASRSSIFDKPYFVIDATTFYPYGETSGSISICNAAFEGETPLSLAIDKEQLLGKSVSTPRAITSRDYPDMSAETAVPTELVKFYDAYPTSAIGGNPLTRWAMYANVPLATEAKDRLYPALRKAIEGLSKQEAAEKLLNWVQTGFVYEYDDKVWGHDRAFFAEETLYYPYCDCEDRSILFSRIVRDLLGLDVALIYYPGHLATAVCFDGDVNGDAMTVGGRRFTVCDPTYIGAPVGAQMPGLAYDKAQALLLDR